MAKVCQGKCDVAAKSERMDSRDGNCAGNGFKVRAGGLRCRMLYKDIAVNKDERKKRKG